MTDQEIEIVEELEKHTEVKTMADGGVVEFIDRAKFYDLAQKLVKNIAYEPVLAPVIPEKDEMESECETYIDSVCDETDYNDAKIHLRYAFKAGFNYLLNKLNGC